MAKNYFGVTDTGKMRSNNEDTFIAETVLNGKLIAACVIDGVGGYAGGEVAAKIAHDAVLEHLHEPKGDLGKMMREALAAANENIYREKQVNKGNDQMACVLTLALADINANKFYYAHVGDTRLYLFRDSSLIKVTHDHSFVGYLEESGRLSEEAAMRHPKRNEINKALGFDAQIARQTDYIETGDSPFLPGDILLLCSDGLSDMIGNSSISAILRTNKNLETKAKALVQAANDAGGRDNITVVLVHNDKPATQHEAKKPTAVIKKNEEPKPEPVVELNKASTDIIVDKTKRKSNSAVSVLSVLCLLLLVAFLYMLYKNFYSNKNAAPPTVNQPVERTRSEQEQRLLDSIKNPSGIEVFIINAANSQPITITDSILINNDSLHIRGNGATLISDSSYMGPALTLGQNCKYVLLDSLTIQNFRLGILAKSPVVHFKNVQFKNTQVPVQYQMILPENVPINGRFADTLFYNSDTLNNF